MPELPEVECVRRGLAASPGFIGARVRDVRVLRRSVVIDDGDPRGGVSRQRRRAGSGAAAQRPVAPASLLAGCVIDRLERRGKQLAIIAHEPALGKHSRLGQPSSRERALVVQLGMTGQLLLVASDDAGEPGARPHTHVVWTLEPALGERRRRARTRPHLWRLLFRDPRRFGAVRIEPGVEALHERWDRELGPDALSITPGALATALSGRRRPLKAALMDQSLIAGVGNIYADEALFDARLAPRRRADRVTRDEVELLAPAIRRVLERAICAGGSSVRDYVASGGEPGSFQLEHRVYGRTGQRCVRCGGPLRSAVLAQRTTVWCPTCQK